MSDRPEPRHATGGVPGCEEARVMLMGYIDGELEPAAVRRLEDHLAVCVGCRRDEESYRRLGRATESAVEGEWPVDTAIAWEKIYDRIARRAGWVLLWTGLTLLMGYWLWVMGSEFLFDSEVPIVVRLGVGTLVAGMLLLTMNLLRERVFRHRTERYREVQR